MNCPSCRHDNPTAAKFCLCEWVERGGVRARVATPRMLYRMKRGTVRPIDRADAADLKAKFALAED